MTPPVVMIAMIRCEGQDVNLAYIDFTERIPTARLIY